MDLERHKDSKEKLKGHRFLKILKKIKRFVSLSIFKDP
jgi:hypothetical protein